MSKQLQTVGVIADMLDVPVHRVEYVLRTRQIQPAFRAGGLRVFSPEQAEQIAAEINQIDGRREVQE